jgi:hypothetical protein
MATFRCEKYKPRVCRGAEAGNCGACGRCLPKKRMSKAIMLSMEYQNRKTAILLDCQTKIINLGRTCPRSFGAERYQLICACRSELEALLIEYMENVQMAIATEQNKEKGPNEKCIASLKGATEKIGKWIERGFSAHEVEKALMTINVREVE